MPPYERKNDMPAPPVGPGLRLIAIAALLVACGGGGGTEPSQTIASISVTLAKGILPVGGTTTASATVRGSDGAGVAGAHVSWSSSAPGIASVSLSGAITALAPGSTTIAASSGGVTGSALLTVTSPKVVTGLVYHRDASVAWPVNPVPTEGVGGAQLALDGVTTTSNGTGAYSLSSDLQTGALWKPLTVSAPGYIPSWHPWLTDDPVSVPLALYPEVPVTPRPGFIKGTSTHDAGGWLPRFHSEGRFPTTLDRSKNVVGANLIVFPNQQSIIAMDPAAGTVSFANEPLSEVQPMLTDMVLLARERNQQSMIWWLPYVDPFRVQNGAGLFFSTPASQTSFWDAVFAAWTPKVLERAALARDLGVEYVGIGFRGRSDVGIERFRKLIDDIRAIGYQGKIFYIATFNIIGNNNELANRMDPEFAALWDGFVLVATTVVTNGPGEVAAQAQTRARMRNDLRSQLNRLTWLPKPIFLTVSIKSTHGGIVGLGPDVARSTDSPLYIRDYQQQADAYMAAAEVINETPTGNGRVMGLLDWGYHFKDNYYDGFGIGDAVYDKAWTIRGKPAEAVLRWWFARW
jgi:hypothetical protein